MTEKVTIREDEWMAAMQAASAARQRDDPGLTVMELMVVFGRSLCWTRAKIAEYHRAGVLRAGKRTDPNGGIDGRRVERNVYWIETPK